MTQIQTKALREMDILMGYSDTLNNFPDSHNKKDNNLNINHSHLNIVANSDTEKEVNSSCINNNSLIPIIQECEKYLIYLNQELNLNISSLNMPIIHIQRDKENTRGCYQSTKNEKGFKQIISSNNDIGTYHTENKHTICLNTLHLKDIVQDYSVYETLTHELAHLLNELNNIKDVSSNGYHNHFFKIQAVKLGLIIKKRTQKGFSNTEIGEELNLLIKKFNPNLKVFNLIQENLKNKQKSRLFLYECSCFDKNKIRSGYTDLNIVCKNCGEDFILQ